MVHGGLSSPYPWSPWRIKVGHQEPPHATAIASLHALLAASMAANGQHIELCGVKVSIGDEREVVEQSLNPRCRVLRHTEKDVTFYWDLSMPSAGSQGSISYLAGKVTSASRPSPTFRNSADPVAVMSAFARALQAAHDSAGPPAKISTSVIPVPGAKMTLLEVAYKGVAGTSSVGFPPPTDPAR